MKRMLVGCEFSGVVRDAFAARGWDARSNDILPAGGQHIQEDVFDALSLGWDGVVLHPPCTALCLASNRHYGKQSPRHWERLTARQWTRVLWEWAQRFSPWVALENPMGVLPEVLGPYTQIVQPYQHGHAEQKSTCLWLHGVPPLRPTNDVEAEMRLLPAKQRERIFHMPPSPDRGLLRSITYSGIADAMAAQRTFKKKRKHKIWVNAYLSNS